ncbi:hypothetical protein L195_g060175 [Trifolium pratense]|uniref:Uncharacterized protein n=2 Tax=Trifolium pratense TaxID=57577 RepID=A0A2K3K2A4_TRIPR|nr:hypothetical protein L195_g060175 [Trifolium pratense]
MSDPNPHDSGDEDNNNNDVFIDESDIVHEVASDDDEVLPDADANDADGDGDGTSDPDGMKTIYICFIFCY